MSGRTTGRRVPAGALTLMQIRASGASASPQPEGREQTEAKAVASLSPEAVAQVDRDARAGIGDVHRCVLRACELEFPRYSEHLIACARQADVDGVHSAQDPTRVPR